MPQYPEFVKMQEAYYTMAQIPDKNVVFQNPEQYPRNYRNGNWPQSGYNVDCGATLPNVNVNTWDLSYNRCRR